MIMEDMSGKVGVVLIQGILGAWKFPGVRDKAKPAELWVGKKSITGNTCFKKKNRTLTMVA